MMPSSRKQPVRKQSVHKLLSHCYSQSPEPSFGQQSPNQPLGKVLILEHDASNRILFADYLEQCGYSVSPLADEQQIFQRLADYQPDVLILNLKMPVMDGYSVIEQLRSNETWKHLAILVVSGYSLATAKQRAYRLGANAYLTKPIFPAELSTTVAALIDSAAV
ncbi:MAG: PleD family two-component system response regulator [Phormidesmis sp.]